MPTNGRAADHFDYLDNGEADAPPTKDPVSVPRDSAWVDKDRTEENENTAAPSCWDDMTDDVEEGE